jgi:hypothetical protein
MNDVAAKPRTKKPNPSHFKPGEGGRPFGATSKYTRVIKEAVLIAAECEGMNGHGKEKLVGYLRKVAREDMRAFCMLLGKGMTLQVEQRTVDDGPKDTVYKSVDEVKREMASKGISFDIMVKLMRNSDDAGMMDGPLIDAEGNDVA